MPDDTHPFERTRIWRNSLADQGSADCEKAPRGRLRTAFLRFRDRAKSLAALIDADLRKLTVHDISHTDALWTIADILTEDDFVLTPADAFLLGGAFLLHDLGLALSAYPGQFAELREEPRWKDSVARILRNSLQRVPTPEEIESPPAEVAERATDDTLRFLHAQNARYLATRGFQHTPRDPEYYLIEDTELRLAYGELAGQVAASHWEPIDAVEAEHSVKIGPLPGFPQSWSVDPLLIALLLRVCDACHLDAQRAPGFLRALKKPFGKPELHWRFQEYIQMPRVERGLVYFTAPRPFPIEDRDAWWVGYELVRQADREVRDVDAVLREKDRPPMKAHGVANAETPQRLCRSIPTQGWSPVDVSLRVGDVARMASILGGERLYGRNPTIPLRELIQNARDAVHARRILERRDETWGEILVRVLSDAEGHWIEVEDTGIGMSERLLSGPLLDFGQSYWGSDLCMTEHPGLMSLPFAPVGKYGIGFFSVFMLGESVTVVTRRPEDGKGDTRVLEFTAGLATRPVLREARPEEQRNDPGTLVRVKLRTRPKDQSGLLGPANFEVSLYERVVKTSPWSLRDLCEWLCPALDVNLFAEEGGARERAIQANDWRTITTEMLCRRALLHAKDCGPLLASSLGQVLLSNITPIQDDSGTVIARACLCPPRLSRQGYDRLDFAPLVTDGGFRGMRSAWGFGLWIGRSEVATRYFVKPIARDHPVRLLEWATDQAQLLGKMNLLLVDEISAASHVRAFGADTGPLRIAVGRRGLLTFDQIRRDVDSCEEVVLFDAIEIFSDGGSSFNRTFGSFDENRLATSALGILDGRMRSSCYLPGDAGDPKGRADHPAWRSLWMSCWGATIEAVAHAWDVPLQRMLEASSISMIPARYQAVVGTDSEGRAVRQDGVDILRRPD